MTKRSIGFVSLVLFVGIILGTVGGELLAWGLPAGVVKDFFLTSVEFNLAGLVGNDTGVITLDLKVFSVSFGLVLKLNITSILGLAISYYFLRFFR
ncbi:MAG: DUF4321 domain-containing protein [Candidatus Marinimicrobia bacterium]|jgi:hypothetical protein|nr:DUF4321 domain-containing protein [Candidatus Neomarinimicrobiota bacterium]MBT3618407.1 DUF4321 domain-containing protein [Candidatus Neomarinimicrobiota bacterium]MBT3829202.1 DUF4321 domain-containing protein [Candidatus Neomarinimicrobiota bacterium]MBT3998170.1 DUF4321 domain-containing protein [Candidatus Neomarinimicrobiota bacterium]MBT4281511.1 DUF4321 domain-containing protein [Candidatus Neomarinimicrobiota bacterium]